MWPVSEGRSPTGPTGPPRSAAGGLRPAHPGQAGSWPAPAAGGDRRHGLGDGSGLRALLSFSGRTFATAVAPAAPACRA